MLPVKRVTVCNFFPFTAKSVFRYLVSPSLSLQADPQVCRLVSQNARWMAFKLHSNYLCMSWPNLVIPQASLQTVFQIIAFPQRMQGLTMTRFDLSSFFQHYNWITFIRRAICYLWLSSKVVITMLFKPVLVLKGTGITIGMGLGSAASMCSDLQVHPYDENVGKIKPSKR